MNSKDEAIALKLIFVKFPRGIIMEIAGSINTRGKAIRAFDLNMRKAENIKDNVSSSLLVSVVNAIASKINAEMAKSVLKKYPPVNVLTDPRVS